METYLIMSFQAPLSSYNKICFVYVLCVHQYARLVVRKYLGRASHLVTKNFHKQLLVAPKLLCQEITEVVSWGMHVRT